MPMYDCGAPGCDECQRAFPDRTRAIAAYKERERAYAARDLPMPVDPSPPCRVCGSKHDVICYGTPADTICPNCCATAEHADGETGHGFDYQRSERGYQCRYCGEDEHPPAADDGYISDRARI